MKHLITSLLLFLAVLLPTTATAYDFVVDGIYYNINGNEAIVTNQTGSWDAYSSYSGDVTIPATVAYNGTTYSVTSIGDYAFCNCIGLTSVTIPNSVTLIGYNAFRYCTGLTSITIPNSVTIIGVSAFDECQNLRDVTIPNSVITIGENAFDSCWGLTSITIGNSVTSIGEGAFSGCTSIKSISVACENPNYDSRNNCNAIIETCSNTLIAGCENTVIPNTVTTIGKCAFESRWGLTSIDIPNSVTSIGDWAFECCWGLTSVTIPNSVTSIGYGAFIAGSDFTDLYCYINEPSDISMGNVVFFWETDLSNVTLHVPVGSLEAYQADERWYPYFGRIVEMELKGDTNVDGIFNIADVTDTIDYLLGKEVGPFNTAGADLNGNGRVDLGDLVELIDMLLYNNQ